MKKWKNYATRSGTTRFVVGNPLCIVRKGSQNSPCTIQLPRCSIASLTSTLRLRSMISVMRCNVTSTSIIASFWISFLQPANSRLHPQLPNLILLVTQNNLLRLRRKFQEDLRNHRQSPNPRWMKSNRQHHGRSKQKIPRTCQFHPTEARDRFIYNNESIGIFPTRRTSSFTATSDRHP